MAEVARLVGMELRKYEKDGQGRGGDRSAERVQQRPGDFFPPRAAG